MLDFIDGFGKVFLGILFRHFEELLPHALFGKDDVHFLFKVFQKEIFEKLFFAVFRRDNFFGNLMSGVILYDESRERVRIGKRCVLQSKIASALHDSAARNEDIDRGIEIIRL